MGLIDRIFGSSQRDSAAPSTQFRESETDPQQQQPESRNAPRRELVQVVLRDTMRKHGIPSDWIECRILSSVSRTGRHGLHVNFVVKKAHDRILAYVFAFQESFERELARYEPRARDWLMSLGWEFQGFNAAEMPDPRTWAQRGPAPRASGFGPSGPAADSEPPKSDEDVQRDLEALFAIRDAALAETVRKPPPPENDFESTQPQENSGDSARK